ncbi:MAG: hypothetical protein HY874_03715 [Chloroflexi bacterium]|nr:hypothetical protein [Chloroflexota bacterium]
MVNFFKPRTSVIQTAPAVAGSTPWPAAGSRQPLVAPRLLLVAACLAAVVAAAAVLATRRDGTSGQLAATVRVLATSDPLQIGSMTRATVEVENRSSRPMEPRFSLTWLPNPAYWRVIAGPEILEAGSIATYEIEAPESVAAPYAGQAVQMRVTDGDGGRFVMSEAAEVQPSQHAIANPALGLWNQRSGLDAMQAPAGWYPYRQIGAADRATITPETLLGIDAARFNVVQDGESDRGGWAHVGLAQEIAFPRKPFDIHVFSAAPYFANEAGWPLSAFGIEIDDRANGLVWLLFQPTGSGDRDYDLPNGQHIHVYDVPARQWASRTVDLPALFGALDRKAPDKLTLKIFIAAASDRQGELEGYISGFTGDDIDPSQGTAR